MLSHHPVIQASYGVMNRADYAFFAFSLAQNSPVLFSICFDFLGPVHELTQTNRVKVVKSAFENCPTFGG